MKPVISLPSPIAERSGGLVSSDYWIKIGIPREYLPQLKAMGKHHGARTAQVSFRGRLIVLLGVLNPDEVEDMMLHAAEKLGDRGKYDLMSSQWKGSDPAEN